MSSDRLHELLQDLAKAFGETFQMVGISLALAILLGIPLGLLLYVTDRGLFAQNRVVNAIGGFLVNVIRSDFPRS